MMRTYMQSMPCSDMDLLPHLLQHQRELLPYSPLPNYHHHSKHPCRLSRTQQLLLYSIALQFKESVVVLLARSPIHTGMYLYDQHNMQPSNIHK